MLNVPSNFEGRGCHGRELGGYGEDAVEFSVREGFCYFSRDAGNYSSLLNISCEIQGAEM